jgi:hypothetical protein
VAAPPVRRKSTTLTAILERAADWSRARPATTLALLWVVAAIPWLIGTRTIPYDAKDEFYPGVVFTAESLLRGEAPFWNPYLYSGYPSFADPQAMTFSPTVVLPMLVAHGMVWFDVVILLHVLLGGLGILRLGRSYGWREASSLIAALVFMFGGVAASRLEHTPIIVTWAFLPWVFVAIRAVFRGPSWRAVAGLGLALGLSVLQLTHVTYLFLLAIAAYSAYRLVATLLSEGRGATLSRSACLAAAAAIASVVAAPQLIATLAVLPYSNRGHFELDAVSFLSAQAYLTLLSPNVLGTLSGQYVGPNDITETYFYIGAFPLVLLVAGLARLNSWSARAETWFWTSALAFSIVYAMGTATPVFALLHRYLPGVAYFRRTTEAAFLFIFCAAVLVGSSIDRAGTSDRRGAAPSVRALAVIAAVLFVAAILICVERSASFSWSSLVLLGAAVYCFARTREGRRAALWSAALVLAIFVDLRIHNVANRLNAHRPSEYRASESLEYNATLRFLAQRLHEGGHHRIELRTGASELNAPETLRIASIGGLNPFVLRDYVAFVGLGTEPLLPRSPSGVFDSYRSRVNDLLGVRYLVASDAVRRSIEDELGPGYGIVAELPGRVIWENRNALPRVLRPRHAISGPPGTAYAPAMLDSIDLQDKAYVEAPEDVLAKCSGGRAGRAEIVQYANNEVVVAVQTDRPAWITLNDVFLDGWRAEIAGNALPVYRANGIFRAVCVPAGQYSLVFIFQPFRYWVTTLWAAAER